MGSVTLISGLAVVAVILLILFIIIRQLDLGNGTTTQYMIMNALQLILIGFVLGIVVMVGKVGVESYDNCSWLVLNSTTSGNMTSYGYDYQCETNTNGTASLFYQMTLWMMRLITLFMILAFAFDTIQYFGEQKKRKIEGEE